MTTTSTALHLLTRKTGENTWLSLPPQSHASVSVYGITPEVLPDEESVGAAQLGELRHLAESKEGPIVIILLGGRGAQALHRKLGALAAAPVQEPWVKSLLSRLHVFMQDALAPMPPDSSLSFVYDFRRLLGDAFLRSVASFNILRTDTADLEQELATYVEKMFALGGPDIFFLGHGPEPEDASHLAYIRPNSGAQINDVAGLIPISSSILEHHISKFKAGGIPVSTKDEAECRRARYILTLGPAVILASRRIVQSIVDAGTAPAKKRSYRRFLETKISTDPVERVRQMDANPGLWIRLHPNVRSLVLPDVLS
ncbi:MAG: 6-phosphogluconolactonase [Acidobacteriaceae bacterium]